MKKWLNNSKGARQQQQQQPVAGPDYFVEPQQYEEKQYVPSGLGIVPRNEPIRRKQPPPRPARDEMMAKGLPRLPFEPGPPPSGPPPSMSYDPSFRPASSLYSEPSPAVVDTRYARNGYETTPETTYTTDEEVSPPSSPDIGGTRKYTNDGNVSPIEEMPDISRLDVKRPASRNAKPTTSIPVLRREPKRNQVAAAAASFVDRKGEEPKGRISKNPKFDPYTGEVTTSERGKPQSAKPGGFAPPGITNLRNGMGLNLGIETTVSGAPKQHTSFSDRVRKFKGGAPPERPEWKGATGRVAIPPPVLDNPTVRPLYIPRKSSRRVASPVSDFRSQSSSPVTIVRGDDDGTYPISPTMQSLDPAIRTVVTGHRATPSEIDVKADVVTAFQTSVKKTQVKATTPPEVILQNSESVGKIERDFQEALKENFPPSQHPQEEYYQPPSRFSVTTYAPSEARSSPRPSTDTYDRPPLPTQTPPQSYTFQQISPIVNRRRPKVDESPKSNSSKTLARKAVPGSPIFISMSTSHPMSKRSSSLSTAKNLPMSPAEAQSHDLVTALQAQLDDLAHRRMNVMRSIRQMTELMPQDRVLMTDAVRVKRENEKLMIERLKVEDADIRREEHEIGLRLHRAWKRRDNMAEFEPTGLWVRRVGSN